MLDGIRLDEARGLADGIAKVLALPDVNDQAPAQTEDARRSKQLRQRLEAGAL